MSADPRPRGGPPPASEPPDLSAWTIGVIGLGTMGTGMAHRLTDAGAKIRIYNRTAARAETFAAERGALVAATPADAADGCDLVLVSVADDQALQEVMFGSTGAVTATQQPRLVLNTSTVAPDTLRSIADRLPLLAAGILGNGEHARRGQLRWYVGGPPELIDTAEPVLAALGHQVLRLDGLADGMRLKIAMNLLMGLEMQALAEVVALGEASGLTRDLVLDAVTDSGFAAPVMRFKARRMASGHYGDADFRLRLMAKDLALAVSGADAADTALPMARAAALTHEAGVTAGLGDADCAAILQVLQQTTTGKATA